jgi:hypothetical protein
MTVHARDFTHGHRQKLFRKLAVVSRQPDQCPSLDDTEGRWDERLGRQGTLVPVLKPKDVAGEIKSTDGTASVGEYFCGLHRTGDDLVDVIDRVTLAADLGIHGELHRGAEDPSGQDTPLCGVTGG